MPIIEKGNRWFHRSVKSLGYAIEFSLNTSSRDLHILNVEHFRRGKAGRMCGPLEERLAGFVVV
jgi:hypothetical protein